MTNGARSPAQVITDLADKEITRLRARVKRLEGALAPAQRQLEKVADQFAFYADEHAKKRTKEGDAKGATNHQWALACAKADLKVRAALADRDVDGGRA